MKNAINYYYNFVVDDIHQTDKMFYFDYANIRYALIPYNDAEASGSLQEVYNTHLSLLKRNIYVHQIILNKDGQLVTVINGSPYVMLKLLYYKDKITLESVLAFSNIGMEGGNLERTDWGTLWSNKNDHLEYQISQLGQKHPIIRDSFSYFIGLGETSIQLVNGLSKENLTKIVAHKRIRKDDTLFDLYNPLNLIVDNRVRDVSEYFKNSHFSGKDISEELNFYFANVRLSTYEYLLFLARMLYPTYYFDLYEDIISGSKNDSELQKIIDRVDDYEIVIKNIYRYYKTFMTIPTIEWLEI